MKSARFLFAEIAVAVSLSCGDSTGPVGGSNQIAFSGQNPNGTWDIFVVNADGTGLRNLTRSAATDMRPAWNPARTQIAFYSERVPAGLYIMNANGSGLRRIDVGASDYVEHIGWSP